MRTITRLLVPLAALGLILGACGDDVPSRSDFITAVKKQAGPQFVSSLTGAGIDKTKADQIVDQFLGCVYDHVQTDKDLLKKVSNETGNGTAELTKAFDTKAKPCYDDFAKNITPATPSG